MSKTILQLSSDFLYQGLYGKLVRSLDDKNIKQKIILIPRKGKSRIQLPALKHGEYIGLSYFPKILSYLYLHRIKYYAKILMAAGHHNVDLIYSHFLFTDGGVARKINEKRGVPYIVSVRNTDINFYYRYFPFYRGFALEILENAKCIVFLSPAIKKNLLSKMDKKWDAMLDDKSVILPNGISDDWYLNQPENKICLEAETVRILYYGEFSKNKNIESVIHAVVKLNHDSSRKFKLTIIGEYGNNKERIAALVNTYQDYVESYAKINTPIELIERVDANHIFVMPSFKETFGLAYIESMARGLPVIYSQGQGIDGYFDEGEVGYSVDPHEVGDLVEKIDKICTEFSALSKNCLVASKKFTWEKISQKIVNNLLRDESK